VEDRERVPYLEEREGGREGEGTVLFCCALWVGWAL